MDEYRPKHVKYLYGSILDKKHYVKENITNFSVVILRNVRLEKILIRIAKFLLKLVTETVETLTENHPNTLLRFTRRKPM